MEHTFNNLRINACMTTCNVKYFEITTLSFVVTNKNLNGRSFFDYNLKYFLIRFCRKIINGNLKNTLQIIYEIKKDFYLSFYSLYNVCEDMRENWLQDILEEKDKIKQVVFQVIRCCECIKLEILGNRNEILLYIPDYFDKLLVFLQLYTNFIDILPSNKSSIASLTPLSKALASAAV